MEFLFTREQELLRDAVQEFVEKEVSPKVPEMERTRKMDYDVIRKLEDQGFQGIIMPKEYGGQGASHIDQAIILEEIAAASLPIAWISLLAWAGAYDLCKVGTEEAKRRWLPQLFDGKHFKWGSHAATEPDAGSDAGSYSLDAKVDGDGFTLNGTKLFISTIEKAEWHCVTVRCSPDRYHGMATVLVEKDRPGVRLGRALEFVGLRGFSNGEVVFENCKVPRENLLGEMGRGFHEVMGFYETFRPYNGITAVGAARAAFEAAVSYCQQRKQFGKPIGDFQLVRAKLADMAIAIDAARFLCYRSFELEDKKIPHDKEASMAKIFATEMAQRVTWEAIQIHGGYGLSPDFPVERIWRDVRACTIAEGPNDIQRLVIAARVLGTKKIVLDSALD